MSASPPAPPPSQAVPSPSDDGKRGSNKFVDLVSIEDRYAGLDGKLRQDQVWADYVIHNCKTLRLFGTKGEQLLSRHEDNNRGDSNSKSYHINIAIVQLIIAGPFAITSQYMLYMYIYIYILCIMYHIYIYIYIYVQR